MNRIKVAGTWRSASPLVKVGAAWKDIDAAWIKVAGVWKRYRNPFVVKGYTVSLTAWAYGEVERRSFMRNGNGPAAGGTPGPVVRGSISNQTVVINGVTLQLRGIESGGDSVGGVGLNWKWISIQFFGNVDASIFNGTAFLNGKRLTFLNAGWNAQNDHTYITYAMDTVYQFPVDTPLSLTF